MYADSFLAGQFCVFKGRKNTSSSSMRHLLTRLIPHILCVCEYHYNIYFHFYTYIHIYYTSLSTYQLNTIYFLLWIIKLLLRIESFVWPVLLNLFYFSNAPYFFWLTRGKEIAHLQSLWKKTITLYSCKFSKFLQKFLQIFYLSTLLWDF